jgi:hypothetical protein
MTLIINVVIIQGIIHIKLKFKKKTIKEQHPSYCIKKGHTDKNHMYVVLSATFLEHFRALNFNRLCLWHNKRKNILTTFIFIIFYLLFNYTVQWNARCHTQNLHFTYNFAY